MSKRMWRKSGPRIEPGDRKGLFDVCYGTDSEKQKFDLWLPEGEGPFPVILSIHGGGFIACDKRDSEMLLPMLEGLSRGYAVVGMNYRLTDECCFPEPVRDVKRCLGYLQAHGEELGLDLSRIVLWGGSAGGYLALMGAVAEEPFVYPEGRLPEKEPVRPAACIAWYPLVDICSAEEQLKENSRNNHRLGLGPSLDVSPEYTEAFPVLEEDEFPFYEWEGGMRPRFLGPYNTPELAGLADVKRYVHPAMPPVFLQHGLRDEIVPIQQSEAFAEAAKKAVGEGWGVLEAVPEAIHSSVLFEVSDNLNKVFFFLKKVLE